MFNNWDDENDVYDDGNDVGVTKKKYSFLGCIISFCVLLGILNVLSM